MADPQKMRRFDSQSAIKPPEMLDPFLTDVAGRTPSHQFLGGASQGVYRSQIALLRAYAEFHFGDISRVRVLDWGAGKGHISYLLKKEGFQVTTCDIARDAIDSAFAQEIPIIQSASIDVVPLNHNYILPFEDASFDIVVSFGVLEHVEDDLASLKEIRRVLVPQGRFFFCFLPFWLSWSQRLAHMRGDFYHSRLYKRSQIKRMAEQAGFRIENTWHGQLFPKNSLPYVRTVEKIDRFLTTFTPLKYLSTNLEGFLVAA